MLACDPVEGGLPLAPGKTLAGLDKIRDPDLREYLEPHPPGPVARSPKTSAPPGEKRGDLF